MKILNLVQGTPEWLKARLEHFTASEAAAMMGDSKHMSRNELLALKKGWQSNPNSSFTEKLFQKGHDFENEAREIAECELLDELLPLVGSVEVEGLLLLASYDGLTVDHVTAWEHKMWNAILAENVRNGILEAHYYWQLEQQLLVSGADACIFTVSDGTTENYVSMEYVSIPERRLALIAGWKQFAIDLDAYEIKAKVEQVVANKIAKLPPLQVSLVGQVSNSNLADYKGTALAFIGAIKTELQTDQDFKDANEAVKWLKNGEDELEAVKERALSDTADIKLLFETINDLKEEMRQKRLKLNKLTKSEKERIRAGILQKANNDLTAHINEANKSILPILFSSVAFVNADFSGAMKGKSTVDSLQNAVDTTMANAKIEVNETIEKIKTNLDSLKELASKHKFLFNDTPQLVLKDNDDLVNLIKTRIGEHEAKEEKRLADQREEMRLEEERKAKIVKVLMPSGIREFDDLAAAAQVAKNANGYLDHKEDGSIEFKANEVAPRKVTYRRVVKQDSPQKIKCDGNHGGPRCQDSECWNDDKEQTSADKEVSPTQNEAITLATNLQHEHESAPYFGEYEPLDVWPSDGDRTNSDGLNFVCQKLEEAEAYIQMLLADKAA